MIPKTNPFNARDTLQTDDGPVGFYRLSALEKLGLAPGLDRMPFSIRILLEAMLRTWDGFLVTEENVRTLAKWNAKSPAVEELPFKPARVILQDFTGVPCLVDIAAMRSAMARLGGNPAKI